MDPASKWTMIIGGALTLGGPALGVVGTVIGMMGSFSTLEKSGAADPEALASNIGVSLMSTAGGFIIGFLGLFIFMVGLIAWLMTRQRTTPPSLKSQNTK